MTPASKPVWKIAAALLPGALMGAGAGALLGAFQIPAASALVAPLQFGGIVLMLGSMGLRMALSLVGIALTAFAGMVSNYVCLFLSGAAVWLLISSGVLGGEAPMGRALAVVALGWTPALLLTVLGLVVSAPWRARARAARTGD